MEKYDAIVIGSGTGGQTAAYDLKNAGLSVAMVEKSTRPGGTCALRGCQPKKWFYEAAEVIAKSRHLEGKGITATAAGDWRAIRDQKRLFTDSVPKGTVDGLKKAGIDFLSGTAVFKDAHSIDVDGRTFGADFFVVATGAKPSAMPFEGAEHLVTSSEFLELGSLPDRIVFAGGGFISFEFAHFAARIGSRNRRILMLEANDRPLTIFDKDMVDLLLKSSAKEGIEVKTDVRISAVEKKGDGFRVRTESDQDFEADLVVHGAGRTPSIEALNLDGIGIQAGKKGIQVNERMQTSLPHIFAVGDCVDSPALARVADYEGHAAAENILATRKNTAMGLVDYAPMPFVLFTYPQYGMVGQTEAALKSKKIPYRKNTVSGVDWPTYRRVGIEDAGYKILVSQDDQLLGAHVVSDHVTGLMSVFSRAVADAVPLSRLYRQTIMSPYPSRISDISYMLKPLME